jgi:hypothetical protein
MRLQEAYVDSNWGMVLGVSLDQLLVAVVGTPPGGHRQRLLLLLQIHLQD